MDAQRRRRRLTAAIEESLRELRSQLSLLNRQSCGRRPRPARSHTEMYGLLSG
jgi:hypothetical protein